MKSVNILFAVMLGILGVNAHGQQGVFVRDSTNMTERAGVVDGRLLVNIGSSVSGGTLSMTNFVVLGFTNTITRTNNTTAYAANDYVGSDERTNCLPIQLLCTCGTGVTLAGKTGFIVGAKITTSQTSFATPLKLWTLFSTNGCATNADNVALVKLAGNAGLRTMPYTFSSWEALTDGSETYLDAGYMKWPIPSGTTNIWFDLQTLSAFTPAANQTFRIAVYVAIQ